MRTFFDFAKFLSFQFGDFSANYNLIATVFEKCEDCCFNFKLQRILKRLIILVERIY